MLEALPRVRNPRHLRLASMELRVTATYLNAEVICAPVDDALFDLL